MNDFFYYSVITIGAVLGILFAVVSIGVTVGVVRAQKIGEEATSQPKKRVHKGRTNHSKYVLCRNNKYVIFARPL